MSDGQAEGTVFIIYAGLSETRRYSTYSRYDRSRLPARQPDSPTGSDSPMWMGALVGMFTMLSFVFLCFA